MLKHKRCKILLILSALIIAVAICAIVSDFATLDYNVQADALDERHSVLTCVADSEDTKIDDETRVIAQGIVRWFVGGLFSAIILIGGLIFWCATPKKNWFAGYRTSLSMENDENWKISNKTLGIVMTVAGVILTAILLSLNIVECSMKTFMISFMSTLCVALVCMIIVPSVAMRRNIKKKAKKMQNSLDSSEEDNSDASVNGNEDKK